MIARWQQRLRTFRRSVLPGLLEGLARHLRADLPLRPGPVLRAVRRRVAPVLAMGGAASPDTAAPARPSDAAIAAARATLARFAPVEPDLARLQRYALEGLPAAPGPPTPAALAWRRLAPTLPTDVRRLILVPWVRHGGADLVALHALRAAQAQDGTDRVLLAVTDTAAMEAEGWLPPGTRCCVLEAGGEALMPDDRVALVVALVQRLRPRAVLNVNSAAGWAAMARHGRPLGALARWHGALFCEDYDEAGARVDHAFLHLRDTLPNLTGVVTDNARFREALVAAHGLPPAEALKLRVVYQPAPPLRPPPEGPLAPRVLWAGRFARQKAVDLLPGIAAAAPELSFQVFGRGEAAEARVLGRGAPANLALRGPYDGLAAIAREGSLFLHTSRWDGLPNVLLEAGALALPIVAARVGGVGELVHEGTGWPVDAVEEPAAYAAALRAAMAAPEEARARARRLQALLRERHGMDGYLAAMAAPGGFLAEGGCRHG